MTQFRSDRTDRHSRNPRRRFSARGWLERLESRDLPSTVITPFAPRFSRNDTGDIAIIGNTLMTAPAGAAGDNARNGVGAQLNNNDFAMTRVDVDGDASTFNSSRATLNMPTGVSVLFAGLYWGADSGNAARNQVRLRTPSTGAYVDLTGSVIGVTGTDYEGFVDVTTLVQLAGNGVYTVANVQSTAGSTDRHAGWGLVVVYRDPAAQPRNLTVFDGFAVVNTGAPSTISTTISGFTTPLVGPVNAKVGFIAYEGDLGLTGDFCRLNGVNLTDASNPATNFFNSSVSTLGAGNPGRTPSYVNQMGFDADIVQANGIVPNAATAATVTLGTGGETYYPGVITTAIDIYAPVFVSPKTVVDINGGNIEPGDVLEYTVTVQNTGGDNANQSVLTDPIPTYTSYVPGTLQILSGANPGPKTDASADDQAEFDVGNNRVVFRIGVGATGGAGGSMTVGSTTSVRFRVQVAADVPNNTPIINQATASGKGATAGLVVSAASAAATSVVASPGAGLKLEKAVSNPRPNVGDTITYTLTLRNQGPNGANGIVVRDQLPTGLTFVSAAGTGAYDNGTGDWSVGTLLNGETASLTISAVVAGPTASINTAAIISSSAPDPDPSDNTASAPITPRRSDLALVKSVSDSTPNVGDVIAYVLALTNYGPDPATGVIVTDSLPAGVAFLSASTLFGTFDPGTGIWNVGNLSETGTAYLTINALVTSPAPATNSAGVTAADQYDPTPGNNNSSAVVTPQLADLSLLKTVNNASPVANETITFTLTVSNTGPATATNVSVSDLLPAGMVFVSATPSQGSYDGTTNLWSVGSLASGVSRSLTLQARVVDAAPSMNRAAVSGDQYDPDPGDNTVAVGVVPQTADIDVDKRVSNSGPNVGDTIAYSVRVRNRGPNAATNVYVDDLLPAGVTFGQAITSQGSYNSGTGRWTVGALAVGDEASLTIIVTVVSPSAIINTATGGSDQFDPAPNNNTSQSIITTPQSDLSVVKNVDVATPSLDSLVTYTVTLNNVGPDAATAPTVYDPLPAGLEFVSASPTLGAYDPDNGVWSLPNLPSGGSATMTLVARVIGPGVQTNIARASAAEFDPDTSNNTATSPITPHTILSGSAYEDLNGDGLRGVDEPGIPGVTIELRDDGTNALIGTTSTNADGVYSFVSVPPGTYRLVEIQPANYTDGLDAAGSAGGTVGNDTITVIPITPGRRLTGYTFGEVATPPAVTIGNGSATEGDPVSFAISLSNPVGTSIVLDLNPNGGTATAGSDYATSNFEYSLDGGTTWLAGGGVNGTQVTFPPSITSILARVNSLQDTTDEPAETFTLSGTLVSGAVTAINSGVGTIVDDDPAPTVTIGNGSATEGSPVAFTLSLSNPSSTAIVLDLSASGGTATGGSDYDPQNLEFSTDGGVTWQAATGVNGTEVTVPANSVSILARVNSLQDTTDEPAETYTLGGTLVSGAVTAINSGVGTITDDDPAPTVTIGSGSATEGSPVTFTLSLSNPSSTAIVLDLSASGGTATGGSDYDPQNLEFSADGGVTWQAATGVNGTEVTVPANSVSIFVRVNSLQDTTDEPAETFTLGGTLVSGAVTTVNPGVGTIVDDDPAPTVTIGSPTALEGDLIVFPVLLSNPSSAPIVIDFAATDATATSGLDYIPVNYEYSTDGGTTWKAAFGPNGTQVTIVAGDTGVLVRIATLTDGIDEPDETFGLSGTLVSGAVTAINSGVGTILDGDAAATLTIGNGSNVEGNPISFSLSLSNPSSAAITFDLVAAGGTATAGTDYVGQNFEFSIDGGTTWASAGGSNATEVTFAAGSTSMLVRLATLQDAADESNETFNLTANVLSGSVAAVNAGTGTIIDDDDAPTLTIGNGSAVEGSPVVFPIGLSNPSGSPIVIDLAATNGTAASGVDFDPQNLEYSTDGGTTWLPAGGANGTEVTVPTGSVNILVRVATVQDAADEPAETFTLSGALVSGAVTAINSGAGTITDDDAAPVVTINNAVATEGSPVTFLISLSNPSSSAIVVDLTASSGTATTGTDFDPANFQYSTDGGVTWQPATGANSTEVTIPAGGVSVLVRVLTSQDNIDEADETFDLSGTLVSGTAAAVIPGIGTILDDDPAPTVTIGNAIAGEGSLEVFSISLSNPSFAPMILELTASSGTAVAGTDFTAQNLEYSTDGGVTWLPAAGANGTEVTVPAGSVAILARVATLQDGIDELDETFTLSGTAVSGLVGTINSGTGTIVDDDPAPTVTIADGSTTEGAPVVFSVSLSNPSYAPVTLDFSATPGTASPGTDYDPQNLEYSLDGGTTWLPAGGISGTEVTIPAGGVSLLVRVATTGDATDEPDESFSLSASLVSGSVASINSATGTILDDDSPPTVTIGDGLATEGTPVVFPISLSNPSFMPIALDLTAGGGTATAGADYSDVNFEFSTDGGTTWLPAGGANGTEATVPAGNVAILVRVATLQDNIDEPGEAFTLSGTPVSGTVTSVSAGTGTIVDDDPPPTVTIGNASAVEGTPVAFPVSLSNPSSAPLTLDFAASDGTAGSPLDYSGATFEYSLDGGVTWLPAAGVNGTEVSIPAGSVSALVRVSTLPDSIDEPNEDFTLSATPISGSVSSIVPGVGTILDDDPAPTITIGDATTSEGSPAVFGVNLSNPSSGAIVLDFVAGGGTATPGGDYDPQNLEYSLDGGTTWLPAGGINGTEVTIPAGAVGLLVRVATMSDVLAEPTETFTLSATPIAGTMSGIVAGQGTVIDIPPVQLSGYVWEDDDNDGAFDLGEAPIGGVTVTLTGFDDLGNSLSLIAVTDPTGRYDFVNVRPSGAAGYTLTETQPAAYLDGKESLGTQGGTPGGDAFTGVVMAPGTSGDNYNFGEIRPASLGGFVYVDVNDNGLFELGETPSGGIAIQLTGTDDLGNAINLSVFTAGDGSYAFNSLRPGTYIITEVGQPAGLLDGKSTPGSPFGGTGAANAIGGITIFAGGAGQNYLFADLPPSSIAGVVFFDLNDNGVQDGAETGIANVAVTLNGVDIRGNAVNAVVNTAADGSYTFAGLLAGDYTITETQPALYADGQDRAGNFNGTVGNDAISFTLPLGSAATGYTFGEVGRSIVGTVFLDRNRDGVQQGSEPGIGGLTVTLRDSGNSVVATTTTAVDGSYLFSQQLLRDYTVTVQLATGYLPVQPLTQAITLTAAGVAGLDFGQTLGTLQGSVYRDFNLDGTRQAGAGETGVAGVVITLTGTDVTGASINRSTTTAADGSFAFIDLLQGTYSLQETQPPAPPAPGGLYDGFNAQGTSGGTVGAQGTNQITNVGLAAGADGLDYLFGEIPTADPFGFVYLDVNNNGLREAGEPGIPNVAISISGTAFFGTALARPLVGGDLPGGSLTVLTDANGRYEFNPMPPGLYAISEQQPNGYADGQEQNGDANPPFTVVVGNDLFSNVHLAPNPVRGPFNFGELASGMLAGTVFLDLNGNGTQDGNESGIGGVTIRLTGNDLLGSPISRTYVTGASGSYAFVGVLPGTYTLTEVQPTGFNDGPDFVGTLGGLASNDQFANIVLGPGGVGRRYHFTEQPPTQLNTKEELLASTQATGAVINGLNVANLRTSPNFTNSSAAIGLSGSNTPRLFAIGAGASGGPHVRVFDSNSGVERFSFFAYAPSFTGGVRVAVADVNGDGTPDVITAPGAGGGPHIKVFSGTNGSLLSEFYAYAPNFSGGVYVAAGDVNNDGKAEVITGAGEGGGPHVRVFNGMNGQVIFEQYVFVPTFAGGVRVAAGDLNADGNADVIVAAGPGGGPHVRAFSGASATPIYEFYAYAASFHGGVFVAAGDVNGDGRADIVTAPGSGGGPHVRVFSGVNLAELASYYAFNPALTSGVTVAARDYDGDGKAEIFCGPATNSAAYVRVMNATTGDDIDAFLGYPIGFRGGVFVG